MNYCDNNAPSSPCPTDSGQYTCAGVECYGYDVTLKTSYHNRWMVWGVEWTPYQITWYLDGNTVRIEPNPGIIAPVKIYMGMGVTQWALPVETTFNYLMYVDYIRLYKLRNNCNATINACNYNMSTYPHNVVKSISVGGNTGGCTATINTGGRIVFRATDYIELKDGFSTPLDASFYGTVNPCY